MVDTMDPDSGHTETADPAAPGWPRWAVPALGLVAVLAAVVAFWAAGRWGGQRPAEPPPVVLGGSGQGAESPFMGFALSPERPAPDFELTTHTGEPFRLADARGEVVLLFFGYTYCPDICPSTLAKLNVAIDELGPDAERVQVVFVSVDPERDTPERLARFVTAFNDRYLGVTGSLDDIEAVTERYAVSFYKEPPEGEDADQSDSYTIAHTSTVFLIDPQGQMRAGFLGLFTPEEVVHDVRVVLGEAG